MIILNDDRVFGRNVTFHASNVFNYQRKKEEMHMCMFSSGCLAGGGHGILSSLSVVSDTSKTMLG